MSATTIPPTTPSSYALAAGGKPVSAWAVPRKSSESSPATENTLITSSPEGAVDTKSSIDTSLKAVKPTSPETTPTDLTPSTDSASSDVASATNASSSSSTTSSTTSTADSSSSDSPAAVATKQNLTPAPVPKVNPWKLREENLTGAAVPTSTDPLPAEMESLGGAGKGSKAAGVLDAKNWPTPEEDVSPDLAKKGPKEAKSRQTGKEKWVPLSPSVLMSAKQPPRSNKPFPRANAGNKPNGNAHGDAEHATARGNRSFAKNNRQKGNLANGPSDRKTGPGPQNEKWTKRTDKQGFRDEKEKDEKDGKPARKDSVADADAFLGQDSPTQAKADVEFDAQAAAAVPGSAAYGQGKDKARFARAGYVNGTTAAVNGATQTSPSGRIFTPNGVNHTGTQQLPKANQQQAAAKNSQRISPRPVHSSPQYSQQNPQHYGYQHHNFKNNQFRRQSAGGPTFPAVQRQYFAPQQDFSMYAFTHVFPPQPAVFPGYMFEPMNVVTAQVDYYFSTENLCKDIFLRRNMNSAGLVPVQVLANFNRVKSLTNGDMAVLLDAIRHSHIVELVGNKVRQRERWSAWVLPADERLPFGKDDEEAEALVAHEKQNAGRYGSPDEFAAADAKFTKLSSEAPAFIPKTSGN
ncbi:uncharacterized protein V1510DRAFT_406838 [Dipodascopsis tothii]|uniref:uncharacterized protein n=1 Tax=Dipodascopsis tothii TaxID=44089 RepID=UPI0034CFB2CC